MPYFLKCWVHVRFIKINKPNAGRATAVRGVPKMILMVEFNGDTEEESALRLEICIRS